MGDECPSEKPAEPEGGIRSDTELSRAVEGDWLVQFFVLQ
jgi:hypothetical protein